jgi:REP element-mobilizing transposase RayT
VLQGIVVGEGLAPPEITVKLKPCGEIVKEQLQLIETRFPSVTVEDYVIMPDHIHAVIFLHGKAGGASPSPTLDDVVIQMLLGYDHISLPPLKIKKAPTCLWELYYFLKQRFKDSKNRIKKPFYDAVPIQFLRTDHLRYAYGLQNVLLDLPDLRGILQIHSAFI